MNLPEHYKDLYQSSIKKIEKGEHNIDPLIDSPHDKRFGITLLIWPPEDIKNKIQVFLNELKPIDPAQYYYPNPDIHITVLSIISCYPDFRLNSISVSDYTEILKKSLEGIRKFSIRFRGITASDSGVMIQGFPENEILNDLRESLRTHFKNSDLEQSIDKRYSIQTAHSTVVRFRRKLQKRKDFLAVMENYRNHDFGEFEVKELELVFNDWYQRKSNSELLEKFEL